MQANYLGQIRPAKASGYAADLMKNPGPVVGSSGAAFSFGEERGGGSGPVLETPGSNQPRKASAIPEDIEPFG
jgi:hypothetical protein